MTDSSWNKILIGIACGSLGFGSSQIAITSTVSQNQVRLADVSKQLDFETSERKGSDVLLSSHLDALIDQNSQLIALIKAQNQILKGN